MRLNPRNTAFTIRGLGSSVVAVSQANDGLAFEDLSIKLSADFTNLHGDESVWTSAREHAGRHRDRARGRGDLERSDA